MPLTTRTNGSAGSNIITASWFNDFKNLLTGVMTDQEVLIKNNVMLQQNYANPASALGGTLAAGTALSVGSYNYVYTYVGFDGESGFSPTFTIATTTGNQVVNLTGITVGPAGTTARKIYRTAGFPFQLVTTINDNTTTTFTDNVPDASLTPGYPPFFNTFGGAYQAKDSSGTIRASLLSDGTLGLTPKTVVLNGSTSGTATLTQHFSGYHKACTVIFNGFRNGGGSSQNINLPVPFTSSFHYYAGLVPPFSFVNKGAALNVGVITALASGGGTATIVTTVNKYSIGDYYGASACDAISIYGSMAGSLGGLLMLEGI